MKNYIITIFVLFVVGVGILFYTNGKPTVKVGAIISLTGSAKHAIAVKQGLELAVEEINSIGGLNGRKIELIFKDSQSNPKVAIEKYDELMKNHKLDMIISNLSAVANVLASKAEKDEIPYFTLMTAVDSIAQDKKWVFKYFTTVKEEIAVTMKHIKNLNIKSVGILHLDNKYGNEMAKEFISEAKKENINIFEEKFNRDIKDYKPQVKILLANKIDAIYIVEYTGNIPEALKQIRSLFNGILLTTSGGTSNKVLALKESQNLYCTAPAIFNKKHIYSKSLRDKYEAKYKKQISHHYVNGYDLIHLFYSLMEDKEVNRKSIRDTFDNGFIYSGVFGQIILHKGEHNIAFPLEPVQIVDKKIIFRY